MIYAVDFDGTLYQNDALNMDMVSRIQELRSAGNQVYVHTSRQGKALEAAEQVWELRRQYMDSLEYNQGSQPLPSCGGIQPPFILTMDKEE